MDILDIIAQADGGNGLQEIGRRFNLSDAETRAAIGQLAPAVMAGIRRETTTSDGLAGLLGALASGNHTRYLDGDEDGIVDDGNAILGHLFGSKEVSRGVAAHAAETTGIGSGILKQMLPVIAAMVMGALTRKISGGNSGGGLGDILGQVLGGGGGGAVAPGGGGLGDILGQVLGGGAAAPRGGAAGGGLGDILGQVLGGGGGSGGGGLGDVLGQLTGQPSGGGRSSSGGGGLGDLLGGLFGADAPPEVRSEATRRASRNLDDMLGGRTESGNAADRLLESVDRAVRRR